ncbi:MULTISPECIES: ATP-NAD kinase family protein [unclassified Streptomyces]|uniref:ATP-NAD kinase family protein n=1 Tax=unclassified Streptomyces TaxID=2593676 RepID=UPI00278C8B41|nr:MULTISPECIES: NAD(+)/NADH kinase [unclassified Streptomyces]
MTPAPRVGLLVNPIAGLGGRVGLGGTDGPDRAHQALLLGATPLAATRATEALRELRSRGSAPLIVTGPGPLGEDAAQASGLRVQVVTKRGARNHAPLPGQPDTGPPAPTTPPARGARNRAPLPGERPTGTPKPTTPPARGAGNCAPLPGERPTGTPEPTTPPARGAGNCAPNPDPRGTEPTLTTTPEDTRTTTTAILNAGVDLLLFAGGDGTARDILTALNGTPQPVLGIPTGVKMHSAVFAVGPRAAGEVAHAHLTGTAHTHAAEVMDRDEAALKEGRTASHLHGWLHVPHVPTRVQQRKTGSTTTPTDTTTGIAAELAAHIGDATLILGPGTTTRSVAAALGADSSLTGVDVLDVRDGHAKAITLDAPEEELLAHIDPTRPTWVAVSPIGGQGFLLGRGNQQISPRVLRATGGKPHLLVLCPEQKLAALHGRPLLLDTGDPALDAELTGHARVITGRHHISLYRTTH